MLRTPRLPNSCATFAPSHAPNRRELVERSSTPSRNGSALAVLHAGATATGSGDSESELPLAVARPGPRGENDGASATVMAESGGNSLRGVSSQSRGTAPTYRGTVQSELRVCQENIINVLSAQKDFV